ncbi:MAG: glycosyltransferase [Actinomycetota bacterium]
MVRERLKVLRSLRLAAGLVGVFAVLSLARRDVTAALAFVFTLLAFAFIIKRRSRKRALRATSVLIASLLIVGIVVSVFVPLWAGTPTVKVDLRSSFELMPERGRAGKESIGFVLTENDGSLFAVNKFTPYLSTLAPTSLRLGSRPGTIEQINVSSFVSKAKMDGAGSLLVVSNFDGTAFNGSRFQAVLESASARSELSSRLLGAVRSSGADGVVLDFENLLPAAKPMYPGFIRDLRQMMRKYRVVTAVPASPTDPSNPSKPESQDALPYDLAAIGEASSQVIVMAYEQHTLTTPPGPIAGMPWVVGSLDRALSFIPASKIILGIPMYGYAWTAHGQNYEVSANEGYDLSRSPGARSEFDPVQLENHVVLPNGNQIWYPDERTVHDRSLLVLQKHLHGAAMWQLTTTSDRALNGLAFMPMKHPARVRDQVKRVDASGLVALTFDDGPDSRWTPKILEILKQKHVPATFFVVGNQVVQHPELLRLEARDGFVIGNHTWSHMDLSKASALVAQGEVAGNGALIESIIGRRPKMFRYPYGAERDATGSGGGEGDFVSKFGLVAIPWNDDTLDWTRPGPSVILARGVSFAQGSQTIILMHDGGGDRSQTIAALPLLIDELRAEHKVFVTPDQLTTIDHLEKPYIERLTTPARVRFWLSSMALHLWIAISLLLRGIVIVAAGVFVLRLIFVLPMAWLEANRSRKRHKELLPWKVSICVPAHNEERVIRKTLTSLGRVRWNNLEVIVIDDGSTDSTAEIASRFPVRVIRQPQGGKAAALNSGIQAATGELICVIDADTVMEPDFLLKAVPHFARPDIAAVAGNVKVGNRRNLLTKLQALEYIVSLSLDKRAQSASNLITVVPGAAGMFRKSALQAAGGYPSSTVVEDADLTISLLRAGMKIVYEPRAIVRTEAPESIKDVMSQRRRWSLGTYEVLGKHAAAAVGQRDRHGLLALTWLGAYQVFIPIASGVVDGFLFLSLIFSGHRLLSLLAIAITMILELAIVSIGLAAEREDWRLLAYAPFARLMWRPIQLAAAYQSAWRYMQSHSDPWHRLARTNNVPLPEPAEPVSIPRRSLLERAADGVGHGASGLLPHSRESEVVSLSAEIDRDAYIHERIPSLDDAY